MAKKIYGVWCKDAHGNKGDWLREMPSRMDYGDIAILAFTTQRDAKQRAAREYGYETYTEAVKDGWCEIKPLLEDHNYE